MGSQDSRQKSLRRSSRPPRLSLNDGRMNSPRLVQISIEKIEDPEAPPFINWNTNDVAQWIEELGFPHYRECFVNNFITGRRLILVSASTLPKMGIHNFEDIKVIQRHIRELLGIPFISDDHSIADPYTNEMGLYLEDKCITRTSPSLLTHKEIKRKFDCLKLEPPLYKMNLF